MLVNTKLNLFDQSGRVTPGTPDWEEWTTEKFNEYLALGHQMEAYFAEWDACTQQGWTDDVTGVKLKTEESAMLTFSAMMTQILVGEQSGAFDDSTSLPIWDYYGKPHIFSVAEIKGLLFRYGIAWAEMFGNKKP